MEPGVIILLGIIAVVLAIVWDQNTKKKVLAAWSEVAKKYGLTLHGEPESMRGEVDGIPIHVRTFTTGSGKNRRRWTEVEATAAPRIGAQLGADGFFRRMLDLSDIEVGDPRFDQDVRVRGERAELLPILDDDTRSAVHLAIDLGWSFDNGTWKRKASGYLQHELADHIERALALARRFSVPAADRARRLRVTATTDASPGVRRQALELLVRGAPDHVETRAALAGARADLDPGIRLVAARALRDVELLAPLTAAADIGVAREALSSLAEDFPDHPASATALDALRDDLPRRPAEVRMKVLEVIARIQRPWAEEIAIGGLEDPHDDVRLVAARTLGHVGTITTAVPALVPLRERFLGGELKDVARDAIVRIQARAGSPDAGRLAVVEEVDAGQLTIAQEEA